MNAKLNALALLVLACGLASTATAQNGGSGDGADAERPLRGPAVRQADPDAQNERPMREGRMGRGGESGAFTRGAPRLGEGAEPMTPEQREARQAAMRERTEKMRAKLLKLYDADGNGELSEAERETARTELLGMLQVLGGPAADRARQSQKRVGEDGAAIPQQRFNGEPGERLQRGQGGPEGMRRPGRARDGGRNMTPEQREAFRAEMIQRFDTDGDGVLSDDERRVAADSMRAQQRQRMQFRNADTNRDGVIDAQELIAATDRIRSGDRRADFNGDGVVNEADIAALTELARRNQ
jgi:Ca2+-binding EF-hand superfamily protein